MKFTRVQPSLPVSSIPDAIKYYTEVLGFRVVGRDGDNHTWLQLADDESVGKFDAAVNVYLRLRGFPSIPNDVQFGKIYIRIDGEEGDLEKLGETLKSKGALVKGGIEKKPWGLKDLTVEDHDGNVLVFNQMIQGYVPPASTIFKS